MTGASSLEPDDMRHTALGDHDHEYVKKPKKLVSKKKRVTRKKMENVPSKTALDILNALKIDSCLISHEQENALSDAVSSRSTDLIAQSVIGIPSLRRTIVLISSQMFSRKSDGMRATKAEQCSITMKKSFEDLSNHSWSDDVGEMLTEFPELLIAIVNLMLPTRLRITLNAKSIEEVMPKIGMIYSIMMNCRYTKFNAGQTIVSCILADHVVDSKVYDRLNALGICTSHSTMCELMDRLSNDSDALIKKSIANGKYWRIIGDNLNFTENVRDERIDVHHCMHHYFLSNVLVSEPVANYNSMTNLPKIDKLNLCNSDLIPTRDEIDIVIMEMLPEVAGLACTNLPFLETYKECLNDMKPHRNKNVSETQVHCLGALPLNESKYQDVVRILEDYQNKIKEWHDNGDIPNDVQVVIGGDLLTAERFRYGKLLRVGNSGPEGFANLGTVVFEMFHLQMKYLNKVTYASLWNEASQDQGTMKVEADRISRKSVNTHDNNHHNENKDYSDSFTRSLLLVALQKFFGLENLNVAPTMHCPPDTLTTQEKTEWLKKTLTRFISEYALHGWVGNQTAPDVEVESRNVVVGQRTISVTLKDGSVKKLQMRQTLNEKVIKKQKGDLLKNYSHLALELGMISFAFDSLCSNPDHERFIIMLKMIMMVLKSSHSQGKYAHYICRMLLQQLVFLPEREAYQIFYSNFVKTKNTFVPADQSCEWTIGHAKRLIKHMGSNRSAGLILKRTKAMPSIATITENNDQDSRVVRRVKVHGHRSSSVDELAMFEDLVKQDPFTHHAGRELEGFKNVPETILSKLDYSKYSEWLKKTSNELINNIT